jgi:pilus assembly protein FimV
MMADAAERHETGATATLAALDGASAMNLDFEVGEKTVETPAMPSNGGRGPSADHGFDLDSETAITKGPAIGDTMVADELTLPPLEPVTMSEVGTKLDLARAYVDMGDPDGARNILQEVLQEGSMSQKQEAQRLLDSIPG